MRVGLFVLAAQFPGQGQGEALHRAVSTAEAAEESGLDSVWLGEHHFVPYGVCPSAVTLAAMLLGRTRRIGVGTAVSVLPNTHPVTLGEQTALLHLTSQGRFTLGVGRGGPWVDLEVFGGGREAYEQGYPESLELLLRWLREPRVGTGGEQFTFREVDVVPRADEPLTGLPAGRSPSGAPDSAPAGSAAGSTVPATEGAAGAAGGPPVVLACTSAASVRLAAQHALPMLLGMHCGDEEKAEVTALWRREAAAAGHSAETVQRVGAEHVSAGVAQVADSTAQAREILAKAMPGWLREGLGAHRTVDGRQRTMRDPVAYTELLCDIHPVGTPQQCADRLAATSERTGISRFALLAEGSGDLAETRQNVQRLGTDVLPQLT